MKASTFVLLFVLMTVGWQTASAQPPTMAVVPLADSATA